MLPPTSMPSYFEPMGLSEATALPAGPFLYEVKYDGHRMLGWKNGESVRLFSRNGNDRTREFPHLVREIAKLRCDRAILDGEVTALDAEGRSSFELLGRSGRKGHAAVFFVFDLLFDGRDLRSSPIEKRKQRLREVIKGTALMETPQLDGDPAAILAAAKKLRLEGIVAKKKGAPYISGKRGTTWLKVLTKLQQEFVVGGFECAGGRLSALLVGHFVRAKLIYTGRVEHGLNARTRAILLDGLKQIARRTTPFDKRSIAHEPFEATWVHPAVVAQVAFTSWTSNRRLRHPRFLGLRTDKSPADVRGN